jgi:hypothetical protein
VCGEEGVAAYIQVLVAKLEGTNHLKYLGIDGRIILKVYMQEMDRVWTGMIFL